jgi:hypothetical protein
MASGTSLPSKPLTGTMGAEVPQQSGTIDATEADNFCEQRAL